jgi:hypothetical protein
MPREGDHEVDGASRAEVAKVVEGACVHGVTSGAVLAARTAARGVIAGAPLPLWLGEVFNAGDTLGGIGNVLAWTQHTLIS